MIIALYLISILLGFSIYYLEQLGYSTKIMCGMLDALVGQVLVDLCCLIWKERQILDQTRVESPVLKKRQVTYNLSKDRLRLGLSELPIS